MTEMENSLDVANNRIGELSGELKQERERARSAWRLNCEQIASYDSELVEKENEIAMLKSLLETEASEKQVGVNSQNSCELSVSQCGCKTSFLSESVHVKWETLF